MYDFVRKKFKFDTGNERVGLLSPGSTSTLAEPSLTTRIHSAYNHVHEGGRIPPVFPNKVINKDSSSVIPQKRKPNQMAFHRTAVLKRTYLAEHVPLHQTCKPDTGGRRLDPDGTFDVKRKRNDEPIQFVGMRDNAKRDRDPSPDLHSNAISKRKLDHHNATRSSVCSPGSGGFLNPDQTGITDEAFDPEMFSGFAEDLGFHNFNINSSGEPLPSPEVAVHAQFNTDGHLLNAFVAAVDADICTDINTNEPRPTQPFSVVGDMAAQSQPETDSHASAPNGPRLHHNIT